MKDYSKLNSDLLLQYWKNSMATFYGCIGHGKANANRNRSDFYAEILAGRGIKIPEYESGGIYNGEGAV
tara:strand:- start:716 stop:922 length:207 start_codon:yes stop_codon:yes gene_type:complete